MTFASDEIETFLDIFNSAKQHIAAFPGCGGVTLYRDILHSHIFFTYSQWESAEALDLYRHSDLFSATWTKTKILFSDKPEAWSIQPMMEA